MEKMGREKNIFWKLLAQGEKIIRSFNSKRQKIRYSKKVLKIRNYRKI